MNKTIASIFMQSYQYFEIVVQDFESKGLTAKLVYIYNDSTIKVFEEKDHCINHALWEGLYNSSGDYIMFMPFSYEFV